MFCFWIFLNGNVIPFFLEGCEKRGIAIKIVYVMKIC